MMLINTFLVMDINIAMVIIKKRSVNLGGIKF